jgi:dolichol-phosphate mannosyltransferase
VFESDVLFTPNIGHKLTVIVPTRNESGNVAPLVARLDAALGDTDAEILFVDDSSDQTPQEIKIVASSVARPVRLLHREGAQRGGGLGSAVLAGLRESNATWAVVMDGDLQHPPEIVPELARVGAATGADVVVASRYLGSGSAAGLSSATRQRVSGGATKLARMVFPRRLGGCSDPMSGFFAVRRDSIDLEAMRPRGFKILLEILARSPRLQIHECAFEFQERHSGQSKASLSEGLLFVRRLIGLRAATVFGRHAGRMATILGFAGVGLTGIAVNSAALWFFISVLGANLLVGAALATQVSTTWNYLLSDRLVFSGTKRRSAWMRFLGFALINNLVLLLRLPLLSWLVHQVGMGYLLANIVSLLAAFAVRFVLSDRYLFQSGESMTITEGRVGQASLGGDEPARQRRSPVDVVVDVRDAGAPAMRTSSEQCLDHRYDIHGIVSVGSTVALKELESFRSFDLEGPLDIEIRAGSFGNGLGRRRARVTQYASPPAVSYEEHLGRRGADFHVDMADGIKIVVGPMLVRSPHVLYTNVVEALLRFLLVSRGYMLLHSACLELDGRGVMMSALTDTGKTGTILRLLRENSSKFLSDDMTIINAEGMALCYPKPLTISQHTLRAVAAGDLTKKEWRRLRVQSRLHSKEGRGIGTRLGEMNMPIMSLNALTQYVVPPPKYVVDRLVPCERTTSIRVEDLFIIERNAFKLTDIDAAAMLDELIDNTDDAYGFPPFRYFAPALVIGGEGYEELRARERHILEQAMSGVRARRLATPDFSWADHIPALARDEQLVLKDEDRGGEFTIDPSRKAANTPPTPQLASPTDLR